MASFWNDFPKRVTILSNQVQGILSYAPDWIKCCLFQENLYQKGAIDKLPL